MCRKARPFSTSSRAISSCTRLRMPSLAFSRLEERTSQYCAQSAAAPCAAVASYHCTGGSAPARWTGGDAAATPAACRLASISNAGTVGPAGRCSSFAMWPWKRVAAGTPPACGMTVFPRKMKDPSLLRRRLTAAVCASQRNSASSRRARTQMIRRSSARISLLCICRRARMSATTASSCASTRSLCAEATTMPSSPRRSWAVRRALSRCRNLRPTRARASAGAQWLPRDRCCGSCPGGQSRECPARALITALVTAVKPSTNESIAAGVSKLPAA